MPFFICAEEIQSYGTKYLVEITPELAKQNLVHVKAEILVNSPMELIVSSPDRDYSGTVTIERAYDNQNNPINVEKIDATTWKVNSSSHFIIEYIASTSFPSRSKGEYLTYLTENCGLLFAASILLKPQVQGSIVQGTSVVNFSLSQDWSIMTDETWKPLASNSFEVDKKDFESLFAVGKINTTQGIFGNNQKLIVGTCGNAKFTTDKYLQGIKTLLDYFDKTIGKLNQKEMRAVLIDLPLPGDYMSGTPRLAINRASGDFGMFEGMFWHYWFLKSVGGISEEEGGRVWWFGESLSPFYLCPVYAQLGETAGDYMWAAKCDGSEWKEWYKVYASNKGTKYDIPMVDYYKKNQETKDLGYYYPLPYLKGGVVLYLLDKAFSETTNGEKNIQDVGKYLYENYAVKGQGYTMNDILQAVNNIFGNDFTGFFDSYIFGNEPLPIINENNDFKIDWSVLGNKIYKSVPNLEKLRPQPSVQQNDFELMKTNKHFEVFFHPNDSAMATMLLLDCEKAYPIEAKLFGGEAKLKIKMFVTYDSKEYAEMGGNPGMIYGENLSAGGIWSAEGDAINWLRPITSDYQKNQLSSGVCAHELNHAMMRQVYPGVYTNWIQWFNESNNFPKLIWLEEGHSVNEPGNPFINKEPYVQLQKSILSKEQVVISFSTLTKMNYGSLTETEKLLFESEGEALYFFIEARYENGLQRLLLDYNKGVTLQEAVKSAFGVTFEDLEKDFWIVANKSAQNSDNHTGAIYGIKNRGVDTGLAEKLGEYEPFIGLLSAYASAEKTGIDLNTLKIEEAPAVNPSDVGQNIPPEEPSGDFPWPLIVIPAIIIVVLLGVIKILKIIFSKSR
ncbi:MAG: hypothetical protein WCW13_04460 [archaeon]